MTNCVPTSPRRRNQHAREVWPLFGREGGVKISGALGIALPSHRVNDERAVATGFADRTGRTILNHGTSAISH